MAFDLDDEELEATRRLNGVAKEEIEKAILRDAKKNLLDKNDTEAAKIIVEKCLLGNWVIVGGRTNYIKLALKTLLAEREADKKKIKELEKENRILLNSKIGTDLSYDDYIPKQKVIARINYYDERIKHAKQIRDKEQEAFYIDLKRNFNKLLEEK